MELALLKVVGRGGGGPAPTPGIGTAPLETDRAMVSTGRGTPSEPPAAIEGVPPEVDGRLSELIPIGGGPAGTLMALPVLVGGPEVFGGGGVARTGVALLGSFLLTHFLRSLS